ncbi:MAG: HAMP domain-containing sensor histidine kinase, partial [Rubrivivax sp.]|nr:HAMP domain-containing sensor histidine kinase [Rubrivivax sp.]
AASSVMRPVADLARRLEGLTGSHGLDRLAPHFADDEVGQLAAKLDDYASQLTHLVVRDREFNADVSHELRTPLAVIRGATELLLSQNELPEKARQRLLRIERAARQSTELTDALLLLSRNERQSPAQGESTDVASVVDLVVETHRAAIGNKPIEVVVERNAQTHVDAPAAVLSVALGNLIGNAFKYTPEGTVIEITAVSTADTVELSVRDHGPGLPVGREEDLFKKFERGDKESATAGVGLGLSLCRAIVVAHGGDIRAETASDGGARFVMRFPRGSPPPSPPAEEAPETPAEGTGP